MRATFGRASVRAAWAAIGIVVIGASAALAAPAGNADLRLAVSGGLVEPVQYWGGGGRCERLRRACIYKEYRDEVGEGNCRRYRAECGGVSYCERLRRACVYKEYRGEAGEGNCRRYRYECGGY
jgi:hypothetical protein